MEQTDKSERLKALQARVNAARAQRDEIESKRNKAFEEADLERLATIEEQAAKEESILADLEAEHGREGLAFKRVRTQRNGMVVVKKVHHMKMSRFIDRGKSDRVSSEDLVKDHLLYPDAGKFNAILEDEYDTLRKCTNALLEMHGLNLREELPGK